MICDRCDMKPLCRLGQVLRERRTRRTVPDERRKYLGQTEPGSPYYANTARFMGLGFCPTGGFKPLQPQQNLKPETELNEAGRYWRKFYEARGGDVQKENGG